MLATMTDRALPLAERAEAFALGIPPLPGWGQGYAKWCADLTELLDDIAAADRLARADWAYTEAEAGYYDDSGNESRWDAVNTTMEAHTAALEAYHARMAQGASDA